MVKFAEGGTEMGLSDNYHAAYMKIAREGIPVGLRKYRFFGKPVSLSYGEF